jgi:hypothetical protein
MLLKYDRSCVAGDFATQLRQRSDVIEKLIIAFESLTSTIDNELDSRKGTQGLIESGLLSCPNLDFENPESDSTSDDNNLEQSFNDI